MNKFSLIVTTLLAAGVFSSAAQAKTFYKWVDETGATHYSERKPNDQEAEAVSIRGGRTTSAEEPAATPTTSQAEPEAPAQTAAAEPPNLKDPERCAAAQENMKTLTTYARIRVQGDDGEMRYLSDEEKQAKMTESQQAVNEAC